MKDIHQLLQKGENADENFQQKLEQAQTEFDRLLEMSLELDENTPFLDNRLKTLSNEIKNLKKKIVEKSKQRKDVEKQKF